MIQRSPRKVLPLLLTILSFLPGYGFSQHSLQNTTSIEQPDTDQRTTLVDLSEQISILLIKRVAVDREAPASIPFVSPSKLIDSLVSIRQLLHESELILFDGKDTALIVHQERARLLPLPVITDTTTTRSEFEWVTLVVAIGELRPDLITKTLRQTIPPYGHLSIHGPARSTVVTAPFRSIEQFLSKLMQLQQCLP